MTNDGGTPPQVRTFPAPERAMPVETNRLQTRVDMMAVRPGVPHTAPPNTAIMAKLRVHVAAEVEPLAMQDLARGLAP